MASLARIIAEWAVDMAAVILFKKSAAAGLEHRDGKIGLDRGSEPYVR